MAEDLTRYGLGARGIDLVERKPFIFFSFSHARAGIVLVRVGSELSGAVRGSPDLPLAPSNRSLRGNRSYASASS